MAVINGITEAVKDITVSEYLKEKGYQAEKVVVEINLDIIPRSEYANTLIHDRDSVEILQFVGGG